MPEKKSEYSILIYALMIVVFLALAILGSYVILFMHVPFNGSASIENHGSHGYGLTFFADGRSPDNQSSHYYASNGSFSGTWQYFTDSDVPKDGSCLVLTLVDYNMTPLYYNGSLSRSHTIRYRTPVACNLSFNLMGLQGGFHDVVFLAVQNPYPDPQDQAGNDFHLFYENCMRLTVIEGNDTRSDPRYGAGLLEKYVTYQNRSGNNVMGYGPWLTEVPFADMLMADGRPSGNAIESVTVSPGQELDYYINVKNGAGPTNERYGRFALLQLLDYEQVPLRQDVPEYVYYGALDPDKTLALHASIKAPVTPGTHVLSLVLAGYPYGINGQASSIYASTGIVTIILNVKG